MKWILKAVVQKTISFFPNRERLNLFFQKRVTKGVFLNDEHFGYKAEAAFDHIKHFKQFGKPHEEALVLELGTGWYPIVPTFFYLTGTGQTSSIDISDWLRKEGQLITFRKIMEWRKTGKLDHFNELIKPDRWNKLQQIIENHESYTKDEINSIIGLKALIHDARNTPFDNEQFDFICSNNTFEHVHEHVLLDILKEFKRVLKRGGVMSHFIDMSDHFAHFDKSISIYNFLRYSKKKWALIDNNIQPQNRMRLQHYLDMYASLGIHIVHEQNRPGDLDLLKKEPIHKDYSHLSLEQLAISHSYVVSDNS
jgi:SAM-dependent methyltransferase